MIGHWEPCLRFRGLAEGMTAAYAACAASVRETDSRLAGSSGEPREARSRHIASSPPPVAIRSPLAVSAQSTV